MNESATNGVIVFDFDNTLVHSRIDFGAIRGALLDLRRELRLPPVDEEALRRLSIGQMVEAGEAQDAAYGAEAWRIVLEYEAAGMLAATIEPGASESLAAVRALGSRLAVLTNNARAATLAGLEKFGMLDAFDLVLTRDEVPMKPDPTGVLRARAELGGGTLRTVVVGDSWLDGMAARLAGVPFVAFQTPPSVLADRSVKAWTTVERLEELPALLSGPWPEVGPVAGGGDQIANG